MNLEPNDPVGRAPRGTPPRAARLLLEIPYRQAGLVALCALAGIAAPLGLAKLRPPAQVASARAPTQHPRPKPVGDAVRLRLALDPDVAVAQDDSSTTIVAHASSPGAALRLDHVHQADPIDAWLQSTPPAAGHGVLEADLGTAPAADASPTTGWRGLGIGLLLGLLLAALREWPGGRMRTVREAEWALGAPVLGAIPTLSTKARAASVSRAKPPADGATTAA